MHVCVYYTCCVLKYLFKSNYTTKHALFMIRMLTPTATTMFPLRPKFQIKSAIIMILFYCIRYFHRRVNNKTLITEPSNINEYDSKKMCETNFWNLKFCKVLIKKTSN